jgi:hypothetical protein
MYLGDMSLLCAGIVQDVDELAQYWTAVAKQVILVRVHLSIPARGARSLHSIAAAQIALNQLSVFGQLSYESRILVPAEYGVQALPELNS